MSRETLHATCVARNGRAVLLRGPSGTGKSDLALRLLALPPDGVSTARRTIARGFELIADDRVHVTRVEAGLEAACPPALVGLIEVRGVGIVRVDRLAASATVALIVDLVTDCGQVPRLPPEDQHATILGVDIPLIRLTSFEASAPLKVALALERHGG